MDEDVKRTDMIDFGIPEDATQNIIKVIGVGGGGCNAVNDMYRDGIEGVTFAVTNTDCMSLKHSPVPVKLQLGEGLGAGGDPEKGEAEARTNIDDIKALLDDESKTARETADSFGLKAQ